MNNSTLKVAKTVFPSQPYFYCKHKHSEVPLEVTESKVTPLSSADSLVTTTFRCPQCHREILYKITASNLKQFLPSKTPQEVRGEMKDAVV